MLGGDDRGDHVDVLGRAAAEEGERDVQGLGRDGPPDGLVGGRAERGKGVADVVGEVEGDEEPEGARAPRWSCAQEEGPEHVERHGGGAVADVGAAAGEAHGRSSASNALETEMQTVPTGLASSRRPGRRPR